ncbi:uncharacterized protein LOC130191328 [Pseudoliparis swirei]|uniref:uncharacterized protein LOC130191328 n=1 Tax=Pseudoliparis swirei TaxID=2059687 RepID=UPI0024BE26D2|nr:uncharacterized protein LOC130191328 [Pseudoliparis swirei]
MTLRLSSLLLAAGLLASSWALTPEECRPLMTPLSLEPSTLYGRFNFLSGYTDNEVYNNILMFTESYWMDGHPSPSSPDTVAATTYSKLNGTCMSLRSNFTIDGNTGSTSIANMTSVFHLLPSCDGCLLMNINSTGTNLDKFLTEMNFKNNVTAEKINVHALYLMSRGTTLKDSDMEDFRKQASCFGFNREPDFIQDPKNDFCPEGEGRMLFEKSA